MSLSRIYNKEYFHSKKMLNGKYYDYNEFSSGIEKHYWYFAIKKALQYKSGGKALDVGCAFGHFTAALPESFEKHGCDVSDYAIKTAKQCYPKIRFKKADISRKKSALKNIHGMLKEDGVFIAGVPVSSRAHFLLAGIGVSLLNADTHITQTKSKTWKEIIFPEFFKVIESTPVTLNGYYLFPFELAHLFVLNN